MNDPIAPHTGPGGGARSIHYGRFSVEKSCGEKKQEFAVRAPDRNRDFSPDRYAAVATVLVRVLILNLAVALAKLLRRHGDVPERGVYPAR